MTLLLINYNQLEIILITKTLLFVQFLLFNIYQQCRHADISVFSKITISLFTLFNKQW